MITPFDDYPIHQTPAPLAQPASGDPNHYDRFFFNGFDPGGAWYLGVALGVYPNRGVIDAAFSVARDGVQRSVFASARAPADRTRTSVGPIRIEVLEPLGRNRVTVEAEGLRADLEWRPRTAAIAEPRQTLHHAGATVMDATRLVQWGAWAGTLDLDGERVPVDACPGTKDRSWGIRPVGDPVPGAPAPGLAGGGFFMLWAPVHLPGRCTHAIAFEQADGHRWFSSAFSLPDGGEPRHASVEHGIDWRPGTRRARAATLTYTYRDGAREELRFEPLLAFQMKGLGYLHPEWPHGRWHGEEAEGSDTWKLDELDPLDVTNLHVQQLCRVRAPDGDGIGVLEQLVIGPHAPSGFTDLADGAG